MYQFIYEREKSWTTSMQSGSQTTVKKGTSHERIIVEIRILAPPKG